MFKFLSDAFFKVDWTCNSCGAEVFNGEYFCKSCEKELPFNDSFICEKCGRATTAKTPVCDTCKNFYYSVDTARSVFNYEGVIAKLIKNFKYDNKKYLGEVFAFYLKPLLDEHFSSSDYITFVPMDEKALKKRGYNQTEILAKILSERSGIPLYLGIEKFKPTEHQANLSKEERLNNLSGCFRLTDKKAIAGKTVLVIDDVMTTGATTQTVANLLKSKGKALKVNVLTIASVPDKKDI